MTDFISFNNPRMLIQKSKIVSVEEGVSSASYSNDIFYSIVINKGQKDENNNLGEREFIFAHLDERDKKFNEVEKLLTSDL